MFEQVYGSEFSSNYVNMTQYNSLCLHRCMALSVAVMVGEARNWIPELVERAQKLNVTAGDQPGADLGPVISPQSKARIERCVCIYCVISHQSKDRMWRSV